MFQQVAMNLRLIIENFMKVGNSNVQLLFRGCQLTNI